MSRFVRIFLRYKAIQLYISALWIPTVLTRVTRVLRNAKGGFFDPWVLGWSVSIWLVDIHFVRLLFDGQAFCKKTKRYIASRCPCRIIMRSTLEWFENWREVFWGPSMNFAKNGDVMVWNIYIFKNTVARHAKMKSEYWTELNALSNGANF